MLTLVATIAAGVGAGCLGSLLGLGGGVFLVPFFQLVLREPFETATGMSLMSVIGTSVAVSTASSGREFINARLAILLQLFTAMGATAGNELLRFHLISNRTAERVFGVTAIVVAVLIIRRLDQRNSFVGGEGQDPGALGGSYRDPQRGEQVSYRLRRTPVALAISFSAGIISTLAGIGGGVLIVPALNTWCGIPLRVAAATSTFVIGVTASASVVERFPFHDAAAPALAAAAIVGVVVGSRLGQWLTPRVPVRALKLLLSGILTIVAVVYLLLKKGP